LKEAAGNRGAGLSVLQSPPHPDIVVLLVPHVPATRSILIKPLRTTQVLQSRALRRLEILPAVSTNFLPGFARSILLFDFRRTVNPPPGGYAFFTVAPKRRFAFAADYT